ncbi:MAG: oligosaccharide flippase family protein [Ignavibacteriaceae bacterium]|nr:oligosaccharide flippase family protein [Ignavibacteriaceae bacterium]
MFDKLKELTKDTAIYGISTMVGRFLNFILVPLYTNIFPPADYGVIQLIYAYVAILNIVFIYGLDSAYLKFASFKDIGDEKDNFSTPYIAIFTTSLLISFLIVINSKSIGTSLSIPLEYHYLIYLAAAILFLDANAVIPFLKLRLDRKAKIFSLYKIINISANIFLNIYLILILHWGIEAIVISNLIASAVSLLLVSCTIFKNFKLKFHSLLFKRLLKFGLPFLPAGFAVMLVQVIDVPILEKLTDLKTVGIYKANYKLGIFMMLFVNMFQFAWQPFFLQNAKEPNAKEMFSKVLTYFTLVGSIILVILSLFISDLAQIKIAGFSIIGFQYWAGLNIVPIILLAYLINGMYSVFSAGIYIEEKSIYVPIITGTGALVNVVVNFLLIPVLSLTGAAIATLASYFVMALGYYYVTQKFYKVKYELRRIGHIIIAVFLVGVLFYYLNSTDNLLFPYKLILLILFSLYIYFIAVNRDEINLIKKKFAESRRKKN